MKLHTFADFAESQRAPAAPPTALYLSVDELEAKLSSARAFILNLARIAPAPRFAVAANPGRAFSKSVGTALAAGLRVVLTGQPHELRPMTRALERDLDRTASIGESWAKARTGAGVIALKADIVAGFEDADAQLLVIAASDVLGGRVAAR